MKQSERQPDGDGRRHNPNERYRGDDESSTEDFRNENGFRFNRGKEGDLNWRPQDYSDEDYRFDNTRHLGYGERYGFAAYGRAHYDPGANRDFNDPRDYSRPNRYNYTWSNDQPFNNREQDYRYHPDRYQTQHSDRGGEQFGRGVSGMEQFGGNARQLTHRGRGPKNYSRSDDRIREEVSERLTQAGDVDPTDVEVVVTNGEVILRGTISDRPMKRRAEDLSEMVMGVKDVRNELRLSSLNMQPVGSATDTGATSDGAQHSVSQTEGARGGGKQTKTPHNAS